MGKSVHSDVLDAALNYIKNTVTRETVCSLEPTTFAQATSTFMLAMRSNLTSDSFTGPAAGDVSGRKVTINEQTNIPITVTGTATHVALTSESVLLYVTTCTSQSLSSGNTVSVPAWKIEINAPT